ncbi:MAG: tyrosine-type recombinase/integrase [Laribacter sp.]|nr:tyrosine-type recombinase/integrase [Laribacter sp.]
MENVAFNESDNVTFNMAAARYVRDVLPTKSAKTQEEYSRQMERLRAVFGNVPLNSMTPHHIRQYLDARSAKTAANREKALISTVFNYARDWGYTSAANPCAGVKGNKEQGRLRYIEDREFVAVLNHACQPLRDAMELAYYTGQRPGDVLKIRRDDVHDGALHIRQNKTGNALRIALEGDFAELVTRLLASTRSMYLIRNENGDRLTYSNLHYRFTLARKAAGVKDFQFRDIRAKSATDTDEVNGLGHAQSLMGHKTRGMTEHYIKDRIGKRVAPTPKSVKKTSKTRN